MYHNFSVLLENTPPNILLMPFYTEPLIRAKNIVTCTTFLKLYSFAHVGKKMISFIYESKDSYLLIFLLHIINIILIGHCLQVRYFMTLSQFSR